jgi:hypothetical protein
MDLLTLLVDKPSEVLHRAFIPHGSQSIALPAHLAVSSKGLRTILEEAIPENIKTSARPALTLYGHGEYHHYTYGLCSVLADRKSPSYAYIHIDQHHDMWSDSHNMLHCGRFTRSLLKDSNAQKVVLLGINTVDYHCAGKDILYIRHENRYLERVKGILNNIPKDVYISIDLDVLKYDEMQTHWPKGKMTFSELETTLKTLLTEKNLIGADILGWDDADKRRKKSLSVYKKLVEIFTGKKETRMQRITSAALSLI